MTPPWDSFPREHRELVCHAAQLGELHRSRTDLPNSRRDLAIGLAALDIFQQLSDRQIDPTKQMSSKATWEDGANIAVKWLRLVDLNKPTFWYKFLPEDKWNDRQIYFQSGDRIHFKVS